VSRAGLLLLLPVVLVLSGCAEPAPATSSASSGPGVILDAEVSPAPTPDGGSASDAATPGAESSGSESGSGGAAPRCAQDGLRIDVVQGDSGAGSVGREIVFTNETDSPCTLRGAPEVFVVDSEGSQVGRAAVPTGQAATTARIRPHGAARATLTSVNIGRDGGPLGESCAPVDGDGYAVTAPGSTRFTYVKEGVPACTGDQVWMKVGPVVIDAGSEG
jgi:hypothetical protein